MKSKIYFYQILKLDNIFFFRNFNIVLTVIKQKPMIKSIGIIGGGISGLSAAYYARKKFPNHKIVLYDSSDKLGGVMQTLKHGESIIPIGPAQITKTRTSMELFKILDELNLLD